nr:DUF6886 family protein [Lysinibacillus parviboronicapiens]
MRIFHVSEESDIQVFQPRVPTRTDLDFTKGLVWAIDDKCLPNFLTEIVLVFAFIVVQTLLK